MRDRNGRGRARDEVGSERRGRARDSSTRARQGHTYGTGAEVCGGAADGNGGGGGAERRGSTVASAPEEVASEWASETEDRGAQGKEESRRQKLGLTIEFMEDMEWWG